MYFEIVIWFSVEFLPHHKRLRKIIKHSELIDSRTSDFLLEIEIGKCGKKRRISKFSTNHCRKIFTEEALF